MLDLGWQEFFLIALVAVLVVGPKDLPNVIRTVMKGIRKVRAIARDFQNSVEEVAREAELDDIRKQAQNLTRGDIGNTIRNTVDPDGSMMEALNETRGVVEETRTLATAPTITNDSPGAPVTTGSRTGSDGLQAPERVPGSRSSERTTSRGSSGKRAPRKPASVSGGAAQQPGRGANGVRRITIRPATAGIAARKKSPVGRGR